MNINDKRNWKHSWEERSADTGGESMFGWGVNKNESSVVDLGWEEKEIVVGVFQVDVLGTKSSKKIDW